MKIIDEFKLITRFFYLNQSHYAYLCLSGVGLDDEYIEGKGGLKPDFEAFCVKSLFTQFQG